MEGENKIFGIAQKIDFIKQFYKQNPKWQLLLFSKFGKTTKVFEVYIDILKSENISDVHIPTQFQFMILYNAFVFCEEQRIILQLQVTSNLVKCNSMR